MKPIEIQEPKEIDMQTKWIGLKNDSIKVIEHSHQLEEIKPKIYEGHTNIIRCMDIHTYTGDIVTGSSDRKIRVWKKNNPSDVQVYIGPTSSLMETKFVDDYIWDKGEPQSKRHLGNPPYPFYQYPVNCYEHILIFVKHKLDKTKIPCPDCNEIIIQR